MQLDIIYATPDPIQIISKAAGTSFNKDDVKPSRVIHCFNQKHMSVFEHVGCTFKIEGISRACSHQLVRHRMASFVQQSQRYTTVEGDDWYVIPPKIASNDVLKNIFELDMSRSMVDYKYALESGIKAEDARYMLPEATKTSLTVSMNVRELFHFFNLRLATDAQWEIRDMAQLLLDTLHDYSDQWEKLMNLYLTGEF